MADELTELLPCPFCGGADLVCATGFAYCLTCHADGPIVPPNGPSAKELWNKRVRAVPESEVIAALAAELRDVATAADIAHTKIFRLFQQHGIEMEGTE